MVRRQRKSILFQPVLGVDDYGRCEWSSQVYNPEANPANPQAHARSQPCSLLSELGFKMWHSAERWVWRFLRQRYNKVQDH